MIGGHAVTTFSSNTLPLAQLPKSHASQLAVPGYPLSMIFYHQSLTANDIRLTVLGSLVLSLMVGVLYYYMQILRQSPERALMRGIKHNEILC